MIVQFKMEVNEDIIEFKSIGKLDGNVLSFKDMNNKQNKIEVYILEDEIKIIQQGTTSMQNNHILNKKTEGFYEGAHNVKGKTNCLTKVLNVEKNKIYIEYDFYFNGQLASNNKLLINY